MDRESRRAACDEIRRRLDAAIAVLSRHDELSSLVERLKEIRGLAMLQARHRETPGDGTGRPSKKAARMNGTAAGSRTETDE